MNDFRTFRAPELELGEKPGSEEPNRTRSEKIVPNPNQN